MKTALKKVNHYLSEKYVHLFKYQPYIQTILLHKIYNSRDEVTPLNGTISEGVDRHQFETFVKYFSDRKVKFIDETDILQNKLDPGKQYIYLTFDDGYYNNFRCIDILNKYNAKATFYISTDHVKKNKAFWWDALAHELTIRNRGSEIPEFIKKMHLLKWEDQDQLLVDNFGPEALKPNGDMDRPMTVPELVEFAKNKCVVIGNHTHFHINMTNYTNQEVTDSIKNAETFLKENLKQDITSISYPHGFINDEKLDLVKKLDYKVGITVVPGKNRVNELQNGNNLLLLNRTQLTGFMDMEEQCRNLHTDNFSMIAKLKKLIK